MIGFDIKINHFKKKIIVIGIVPVENKQDLSDTSITLPWFAISSVSLFPVDIYRLRVSRSAQFGLERGYLQKGL